MEAGGCWILSKVSDNDLCTPLALMNAKGTITDFTSERPERSEPNSESPDYWRAYPTLPVVEFFETLKQNFLRLEWVVIPGNLDDGIGFVHEPITDVSTSRTSASLAEILILRTASTRNLS